MALEVIDDDVATAEAFKRALGEKMPDAIMVDVSYIEQVGQRRIDYRGLDVALQKAKTGAIVILYGFDNPLDSRLARDIRFIGLIGMRNVAYVQVPQTRLPQIVEIYEQIKSSTKVADPMAVQMMRLELTDRAVASLKHDWKYAEANPDRRVTWFDRARDAGFSGEEDEIVEAVFGWQRQTSGLFDGQFFPGVFVDVMGTLINPDGTLTESVKQMVETLAINRPVTVWTDSELAEITPKLRALGINWKIISKFEMAGAEVEEVIDDLPTGEFSRLYGIKFRNYHQV
jgi:hypothetical protein